MRVGGGEGSAISGYCCVLTSRCVLCTVSNLSNTHVPHVPRSLLSSPFLQQELATTNAPELGMQTVPSLNIAYTQEKGYVTADVAKAENLTMLSLSGTKFRKMLR